MAQAMEEADNFVHAVMSQPGVNENPKNNSCKPSAAKKVKLCDDLHDSAAATDMVIVDTSNADILAAINNMKKFFCDQLSENESRITCKLTAVLRQETEAMRKEFDAQLTVLTDKVKRLEHSQKVTREKTEERIERVEKNTSSLEVKYADAVKNSKKDKDIDRSVVVRNLPVDTREAEDPSITCQLVNRVIRDGLKFTDVRAARAVRKTRSDNKPGIVLVTLETDDQARKLLQQKKNLRTSKDYSRVYFDKSMSQDDLVARSNLQTLIREIGKGSKLRFNGKRLVTAKE